MLETWIFDSCGTHRSRVPKLYRLDIYQKTYTFRYTTNLKMSGWFFNKRCSSQEAYSMVNTYKWNKQDLIERAIGCSDRNWGASNYAMD